MNNINNIISAELYKQKRTRSAKIIPLLIVLISVIIFLGVSAATENLSFGITSGFYISASSLGWIIKAVSFVAIIITCFQISNEFSMGTVKAAWVQPISRSKWYAAKILHTCMIVWGVLLTSVILVLLMAFIRYDFNPLVENEYLIHSEIDLWMKMGLTLLLTIWVTGVIVAASAALSLFFNSAGSSISVVIALSLLMMILEIFRGAERFLLSTYISLPAEQYGLMTRGVPLPISWSELSYLTLGIPAAYLAVSLVIGFYVIKVKEIKS